MSLFAALPSAHYTNEAGTNEERHAAQQTASLTLSRKETNDRIANADSAV